MDFSSVVSALSPLRSPACSIRKTTAEATQSPAFAFASFAVEIRAAFLKIYLDDIILLLKCLGWFLNSLKIKSKFLIGAIKCS